MKKDLIPMIFGELIPKGNIHENNSQNNSERQVFYKMTYDVLLCK